jgi:hypothetical protein
MKTNDINQTKREHTHPKVSTGEKSLVKEKHYLLYI